MREKNSLCWKKNISEMDALLGIANTKCCVIARHCRPPSIAFRCWSKWWLWLVADGNHLSEHKKKTPGKYGHNVMLYNVMHLFHGKYGHDITWYYIMHLWGKKYGKEVSFLINGFFENNVKKSLKHTQSVISSHSGLLVSNCVTGLGS